MGNENGTENARCGYLGQDASQGNHESKDTEMPNTTQIGQPSNNTQLGKEYVNTLTRLRHNPSIKKSDLNILYANANGISSKKESLQIALKETKTDIALLCETHLRGNTSISIPGYTTIVKNRETKEKGGLAIIIRTKLTPNACAIIGPPNQEYIWIRIKASTPIFLCCFYGKSESEASETVEKDLHDLREDINSYRQLGNILICGDFNAKIGYPEGTQITRNGQLLIQLNQQTNLTVLNMTSHCQGIWTRTDPADPSNKSVIDYILAIAQTIAHISSITIDEEGEYRLKQLKGKKTPSDHNTILIQLNIDIIATKEPEKHHWKIHADTDWTSYTEETNRIFGNSDCTSYDDWQDKVLQAAHTAIGSRKQRKHKSSKKLKIARKNKKLAKHKLNQEKAKYKNMESTQQHNTALEKARLEYEQAKIEVEKIILEEEAVKAERALNKVICEGGVNSKAFWNIKRKALRNGEDMSCIKNTDGNREFEPKGIKTCVANFFESLYKTEPEQFGNPTHTHLIEEKVDQLRKNRLFEDDLCKPFQLTELQEIIKNLPKERSPGPNRICYEFIIHGGPKLLQALLNICENIRENEIIPEQWQHLAIIMLPKGRKDPEQLDNKRGISLSDVACKVFERLLIK